MSSKKLVSVGVATLLAISTLWVSPTSLPARASGCNAAGTTYPSSTGGVNVGFGGGLGTSDNPWLVCSRAQLAKVGASGTAMDGHYKLAADIDLGGSASPWTPIDAGEFVGVLDGDYRTISNLYINGDRTRFGLFSRIGPQLAAGAATVKRIRFINPVIISQRISQVADGALPAAGIVAAQANKANFSELVFSNPSISGNLLSVGFVVGEGRTFDLEQNYALIRITNGSASTTATYSQPFIGGVVGQSGHGDIRRVSIDGSFTGPASTLAWIGGVIGIIDRRTTVSEAYSDVDIDAKSAAVAGGLVSRIDIPNYSISNSIYRGSISNPGLASGGLVASGSGLVLSNLLVATSIPFAASNTGPLIGAGMTSTDPSPSAFFDQTLNSQFGAEEFGTPKSTADLKNQATYTAAGFSIAGSNSPSVTTTWQLTDNTDPVWKIAPGEYPTLVWLDYWPAVSISAPTNVVVTSLSVETANLTWSAAQGSGFGSDITGYKIESSTNNGFSWNIVTANTGSPSTTRSVSGLLPGNSYLFRVTGIATTLTGTPSASSNVLLTGSNPGSPENLRALNLSPNSFRISWDPPSNTGGLTITSYTLQVDKGNGYQTVSHTGTSADIEGVSVNSAWSFRVLATNVVGSSSYAVYTNIPPVPYAGPVITNLSREKVTEKTVTQITVLGERLALTTSASVDSLPVKILSKSDGQMVIELPALTLGIKDLKLVSTSGNLTHQEAFEVVVATPATQGRVNVGSFNGKKVVYAAGLSGKRISWKVGGKWGSAIATSDFVRFDRPTPRSGVTVLVDVFVDGEKMLTKSLVTR